MLKQMSFLVLPLVFILTACATKVDKEFKQELAEAPTATNSAEAKENVQKIIEQSSFLTDEQKTKLIALKEKTSMQVSEVYLKGLKLHEMLAEEYAKEKSSDRMIRKIKKEMIKNSKERLDVIFKSMKEANQIVGNRNPNKRNFLNSFTLDEHVGNKF